MDIHYIDIAWLMDLVMMLLFMLQYNLVKIIIGLNKELQQLLHHFVRAILLDVVFVHKGQPNVNYIVIQQIHIHSLLNQLIDVMNAKIIIFYN